jgi:hypothetical protein
MDILNVNNAPGPRGRKKYGLMAFIFDVIMVTITGGLWLIWIFVREMRNN